MFAYSQVVRDFHDDDIEKLARVSDQLTTVRHLAVGRCTDDALCNIIEKMPQLNSLCVSSVTVDNKSSTADKW